MAHPLANQVMARPSLQEAARNQAAQLPPLTIGHLAKTLRKLPDRAFGPDAITTQLLRTAPKQALQPLLGILQTMEATAELPTQLQTSLVVMLAKREGGTTHHADQRPPPHLVPHARKDLLDHVSLERLLRQESTKTLGKHGITEKTPANNPRRELPTPGPGIRPAGLHWPTWLKRNSVHGSM